MINTYQTIHYFENRLYISPLSKKDIQETVFSQNGKEYKGAGITSYNKLIGWILSFLGYSFKLKIGNQNFYINKKSFVKFIIRSSEVGEVNSSKEAAEKLHLIFDLYKKRKYNQFSFNYLYKKLEKILKDDRIKNFSEMVSHLKFCASIAQAVSAPVSVR